MTTTTVTLTRDQIRFMELVYRGEGEDGWSPIGKMTLASARHASYQMPHLPPPEILGLEPALSRLRRRYSKCSQVNLMRLAACRSLMEK